MKRKKIDYCKYMDMLLKSYSDSATKPNISYDDLMTAEMSRTLSTKLGFDFTDLEVKSSYDKLLRDLYLIKEGKEISATMEGLMFIGDGGYTKQVFRAKVRTTLQISVIILTLTGTLMAGAYGIFEIWKYYHGYIRPCP